MGSSDRLNESIGMSGLLFQSDPDINGWEPTRAVSPEVAAFRHDNLIRGNRLALEYFEAGEVDLNGVEHTQNEWVIDAYGLDAPENTEEYYTDRESAVKRLRELMEEFPADE